jgi:nitrate/nitrite transporter NarK
MLVNVYCNALMDTHPPSPGEDPSDARSGGAARRALVMAVLIIAGEAIFSLPFHVPRFFRPTMLSVFDLDNAGLGDVFAIYGVTAMLAYFPGGIVADRFAPGRLMATSLWLTAAGGVALALWPSVGLMRVVYGWWGVTTVLLFWAAMIRATAGWGGAGLQGRAFGFLDGGRGLAAAALATIAVVVLSSFAGADPAAMRTDERQRAFLTIVAFYASVTATAGVACWFVVDDQVPARAQPASSAAHRSLRGIADVVTRPAVWLQAVIVVAAYCGYKAIDNVGLYAQVALGKDEVEAAAFATACAWLRAPAAVVAGVVADHVLARRVVVWTFILLALSCLTLGVVSPESSTTVALALASVTVTFASVYALRGVYFALVRESQVPVAVTGTAVGLISVVGFTPDIFYASASGRILDLTPGVVGHQHAFLLLMAISVVGAAATALLARVGTAGRMGREPPEATAATPASAPLQGHG